MLILEDFNVISSAGRALVVVFSHTKETWSILGWLEANGINLILAGAAVWATIEARGSSMASRDSAILMRKQVNIMQEQIDINEQRKAPVMELKTVTAVKDIQEGKLLPINDGSFDREPSSFSLQMLICTLINMTKESLQKINYAIFLLDEDNLVIGAHPFDTIGGRGTQIGNTVSVNLWIRFTRREQRKTVYAGVHIEATDHIGRVGNEQHLYYSIYFKSSAQNEEATPYFITDANKTIKLDEASKQWCIDNKRDRSNVPYFPFEEATKP